MAVSEYIMAVGMVVIAVVALIAGLFASPLLFPPPAEEDPVWARVQQTGLSLIHI